MDVHPAARLLREGLGHESRLKAVGLRDRLDEPFVHDRIVAGAQRVGLVAEREFELAGSEFGDRAFERQALDVGCGVKRVEERPKIVEFAQAINLDIARRAAAVAGAGGADAAVTRAAGIDRKSVVWGKSV